MLGWPSWFIYRVSRRYRTARKRRPNHLDIFKNDNQDVFWKIQFKTFLVELEFLKNMKKWKFFHIGEKSWSENHFDQFPSRILVLSFFQTTVDFPIKMVSKTKVLYFLGLYWSLQDTQTPSTGCASWVSKQLHHLWHTFETQIPFTQKLVLKVRWKALF